MARPEVGEAESISVPRSTHPPRAGATDRAEWKASLVGARTSLLWSNYRGRWCNGGFFANCDQPLQLTGSIDVITVRDNP